MALSMGYLTSRQRLIWELRSDGLPEAAIARKLNVTRQNIHQTLDSADAKVGEALEETAKINKIEIDTINPTKGFLTGYSSHFNTKTFITFSAKNGVQVWYKHEGNCEKCKKLQTCREALLTEAKDRNFLLPKGTESILPSKLAKALFERITGE
jgi:hypothetical protein